MYVENSLFFGSFLPIYSAQNTIVFDTYNIMVTQNCPTDSHENVLQMK